MRQKKFRLQRFGDRASKAIVLARSPKHSNYLVSHNPGSLVNPWVLKNEEKCLCTQCLQFFANLVEDGGDVILYNIRQIKRVLFAFQARTSTRGCFTNRGRKGWA